MIWRFPVTIESTKDNDFTYHLITIALITMLELWLGIIVACIPTLGPILNRYGRPAITKIVKTLKGSSKGNTSKGSGKSSVVPLATIGGTGRVQKKYTVGRDYTELHDSQEAINVVNEQSGLPEGRRVVSPTPMSEEKRLQESEDYKSYMSSHYGLGQAITTTDIAAGTRTESMTRHDKGLQRGVIHVQHDVSNTYES